MKDNDGVDVDVRQEMDGGGEGTSNSLTESGWSSTSTARQSPSYTQTTYIRSEMDNLLHDGRPKASSTAFSHFRVDSDKLVHPEFFLLLAFRERMCRSGLGHENGSGGVTQ